MTSSVRGRRVREPGRRVDGGPSEEPADRRRYLRRRWIAFGVVLSVLVVAGLVVFSSVFGVRTVEVSGTRSISPDTVRAAAAIAPGTPLVRLDTDEVRARVAALPKVFSVEVSRSFPATVEIAVVERTPVAMIPTADGVHLVDGTGFDYDVVKEAPPGLPELVVETADPNAAPTRAAVAVLAAIPQQLRAQLVRITARTAGSITLSLADGRLVKWGSAEASERKAAVLAALLTRPGKVYDVATPEFPTVS